MSPISLCIITGTRAEYGLLRPLISRTANDIAFELRLAATGSHLSDAFGNTINEIQQDGFVPHVCIPMEHLGGSHADMARAAGMAMIDFANYFADNRPDWVIVLGDRFEIYAACSAAAMMGIPIAHISGGDVSEGAVDEFIRHAITKMSYLHFPSNEQSRRRIIQLGEDPARVFNVGALNIENIINLSLLSLADLSRSIGLVLKQPYALVTHHPVTLEMDGAVGEIDEILAAFGGFGDMQFVITKSNADASGRIINERLEEYAATHDNCAVFSSLGNLRYLSAMKHAAVVIGNSSSGLYETPSFCVPCVNIGDRQKGRLRATNVIDCIPERTLIGQAIRKALSPEFRQAVKAVKSPFGDGYTSEKIIDAIKHTGIPGDLKKTFHMLG